MGTIIKYEKKDTTLYIHEEENFGYDPNIINPIKVWELVDYNMNIDDLKNLIGEDVDIALETTILNNKEVKLSIIPHFGNYLIEYVCKEINTSSRDYTTDELKDIISTRDSWINDLDTSLTKYRKLLHQVKGYINKEMIKTEFIINM